MGFKNLRIIVQLEDGLFLIVHQIFIINLIILKINNKIDFLFIPIFYLK